MMKKLVLVFALLLTLVCCTTETRRAEMRLQLEELERQNRADSLMTNDSLATALTDWFDHHGTCNEQMRAYYILGRTHYDRGELPQALDAYNDAADRADTAAADCDYRTLSRVHAQTAQLYYSQLLPDNMIRHERLAMKYAEAAKDTMQYLYCYGMLAEGYETKNMPDSAFNILTTVYSLYNKTGKAQLASELCCALSDICRQQKDYPQAKNYMREYETQSGFFDESGNVESGKEMYYSCKGHLCLDVSDKDNAEYYFRKLLSVANNYDLEIAALDGLQRFYAKYFNRDSLVKYVYLSDSICNIAHNNIEMQKTLQVQAMYDYSRQQEIAQQESQKAEESRRLLRYVIICIAAASIVVTRLFYRQSKERAKQRIEYEELLNVHIDMQAEVMQLRLHKENYDKLLREKEELDERLGHTHTEIEELRTAKSQLDTLIAQKEDELEQQKVKIESYKQVKVHQDETEKQLRGSSVYKLLSEKTNRGAELTDAEWKLVERFVIDSLPEFYRFVSSREYALTTRMYRICILTRLQFPNKAIGCMLGVSAPSISQTRPIIYKKLFGEDDNVKDLGEKLQMFC